MEHTSKPPTYEREESCGLWMRPVLKYTRSVWDTRDKKLQDELKKKKKLQNQAALFETGNYKFEN